MISHRYRLISCRSTVKTPDPTYRRVGAACLLGSVASESARASRETEETGGGNVRMAGPEKPTRSSRIGNRLEENAPNRRASTPPRVGACASRPPASDCTGTGALASGSNNRSILVSPAPTPWSDKTHFDSVLTFSISADDETGRAPKQVRNVQGRETTGRVIKFPFMCRLAASTGTSEYERTFLQSWAACHRRCPQTRCAQPDCLFRPVEMPNDHQSGGGNNGGKTPTADTVGFSSSG